MLYVVWAILGVNSWTWHAEIQCDNKSLCYAMMVEFWTRMREGGCRCEWYGGYEQIWQIRGTTCLVAFGRPRNDVISLWIGTRTCLIWDGAIDCHMTFSRVPVDYEDISHPLFVSFSIPPSPKTMQLSHPSRSLHAMIMSKYQVQHTPSTTSSHDWLTPAASQSLLSELSMYILLHNSIHFQNAVITNKQSHNSRSTFHLSHSLKIHHCCVLLPSHTIVASSVLLNALDHALWSVSLSSCDHSLQVHLYTRSITGLECISKLAWSWHPRVSPSLLNLSLQMYLQSSSIMALKYISQFTWSWPQSFISKPTQS